MGCAYIGQSIDIGGTRWDATWYGCCDISHSWDVGSNSDTPIDGLYEFMQRMHDHSMELSLWFSFDDFLELLLFCVLCLLLVFSLIFYSRSNNLKLSLTHHPLLF